MGLSVKRDEILMDVLLTKVEEPSRCAGSLEESRDTAYRKRWTFELDKASGDE